MSQKPTKQILHDAFFNGNGVARRLIVALVLFSTAITAVFTTLELYRGYQADVGAINSSFSFIRRSSLPVLTDSVWVSDNMQINAQLEGLLNLRDLEYVAISVGDEVRWSAGELRSARTTRSEMHLVRSYRGQNVPIGQLTVVASLDTVWARLWDRLIVVLIENGIKTLLVALFMLLVFQLLVTRHLAKLSHYARNYDPRHLQQDDLTLDRPATGRWRPDALDYLVNAVNDMRHKLRAAYLDVHDSEERLRLAMEATNEGVWDWSVANERVLYSPGWTRMLGYEPDELPAVYASWESRIHPADRGEVLEKLQAHLQGQTRGFIAEHRLKTKSGDWLWVVGRGRVIEYSADGAPLRAVGTMNDISALKEAEHKLLQLNEELEQRVLERTVDLEQARVEAEMANQAKSSFLSRMSHELRTPMNAILGFAQLLDTSEKPALSPEQSDYVQEILFAGRHLLELINEVLDLARVESGRLNLELTEVDVANLAAECIALIKPLSEEKSLTVSSEVQAGCVAFADPLRLRQVLLNLLTNAVKYNQQGGKVTLKAHPDAPLGIYIGITDSGSGIAKEDLPKLFRAFERLGASEQVEGTGIGLALSQRLIEAMGGEIHVESEPGEGSTFWLTIPAAPAGELETSAQ